ncbi:MAG: hypothetical protein MN733_39820 [Nitrososphaera sp.]|nr:hypothetical protein [Nitrososphaera sp.]
MKALLKKYIKKPLENCYWWIYGFTAKNPKLPVGPRSFLFICRGNICRSVFAQCLASRMAGEIGIGDAVFDSAGLQVTRALPPPQQALMAAREFGVSLEGHRSKEFSQAMAEAFDMVITMEAYQLETLRRLLPQRKDRFFLLPLFDGDPRNRSDCFSAYNIEDPYGKDVTCFRTCYVTIDRCLAALFRQLSGGGKKQQ